MDKNFNYAELTATEKKTYVESMAKKGIKVNAQTGYFEDVPEKIKKFAKSIDSCVVKAVNIDSDTDSIIITVDEALPMLNLADGELVNNRHNIRLNGSTDEFLMGAGLGILAKDDIRNSENFPKLAKLMKNRLAVNINSFASKNGEDDNGEEYGWSISVVPSPVLNVQLRELIKLNIEDLGLSANTNQNVFGN